MPNFQFPRFFGPNYYPHYRDYYYPPKKEVPEDMATLNQVEELKKETSIANTSHSRSFSPVRFNFDDPFNIDKDKPIIEILGIPLYLDDLIIIGLLFFLYQEGVKDETLFFTLILLLLT